MCDKCNHDHHAADKTTEGIDVTRRNIIRGAGIAAAAAVVAPAMSAMAAGAEAPFDKRKLESVVAYGMKSKSSPFEKMMIKRRDPLPDDVVIDIHYASICHSDIHQARSEWPGTVYPIIPGHEMLGRVVAVGNKVTKFKVGDFAGVGCMVDSCMTCDNCLTDREQNCLNGVTWTYNSKDPHGDGVTMGGYAEKIVVPQHFAIRIPPGVDLAATTPLLCAGITTFSPMQHWDVKRGMTVGVIGMGGLGHMAVKLAASKKADVIVFTTSPSKIQDAKRMGAKDAVLWSDAAGMKKYQNALDWIISTVPQAYDMQSFVNLLKLDKTLVNVGALDPLQGVIGSSLIMGRKSLAGSLIGSIAETQEVVDYCASRNIKADIEMIKPSDLTQAYDRVVDKAVRYRYVIDMKAA